MRPSPRPRFRDRCARALLVTTLLTLLAGRSAAQAPPVETLVVPPVADTYVTSQAPATNFGSDAELRTDTVPLRVIYLRYIVSGLASRAVSHARLRLTVSNMSDSGGTVHRISDTGWAESAITFTNRPSVDGPGLATLGPVATGAVVEFNLDGVIVADGTYAFAIDTLSSDGVSYLARPDLLLTVEADPAPQIRILQPPDGSTFFEDDAITLQGTATDAVDGDIGGAIAWSSDVQGELGTGALLAAALVPGQHVLTARVLNGGGRTATATVSVRVVRPHDVNTPPLVTITAPLDAVTVPAERVIRFAATARDLEDGPLDDALAWSSDADGPLGTGPTLFTALRPGTHRITAHATDSGGLAGSAATTIVVLPPVTLTFPAVADTYADAGKTSANFGTATTLRASGKPARLGYLRFAVAGIGTRPVRSAVLRLQVGASSSAGSDRGGVIRGISSTSWKEKSVTFKSKPALDGPVLASLGAVVPGQRVDVPVTGAVTRDGAVSFAIASTSTRAVTYATRETSTPPTLTLTLGNAAPAVSVIAPADGTVVFAGTSVELTGAALDAEDGDLGPTLTWSSSIDGPLGAGTSLMIAPTISGRHTITASATDLDGTVGTATVTLRVRGPNQPPRVTITNPAPGTSVVAGTLIAFAGRADDDFDTALAARLQWSSSLDGPIGTGAAPRGTLSEGSHTITARVLDSDGAPDAATVTLLVTPTPPTVQITAPTEGATLTAGVAATFRASASDATDGDLSSAIVWASDSDGRLGTGATLATAGLSLGVHRITATVTDRAALRGDAERIVVVQPPPAGNAGVRGSRFGSGVEYGVQKATAEKPESKLWHHDGIWWGSLYRPSARGYRIHRLDPVTQTWIDTGTLVDERPHSRQDTLSDGDRLYILSRHDTTGTSTRLLRYTYVAALRIYLLEPGFPVRLPGGGTESMTLARDSTGRLWVAYTLGGQVWVNASLASDTQWGTPFKLPVSKGTRTDADDIAAVIALPGAIGVFWSNQVTDAFYFAVHPDAAAPASSWRQEVADSGGQVADDHFNLKPTSDGRLFAFVKTSRSSGSQTQVGILVRSPAGQWSPLYPATTVASAPTRPQCLIDEVSRRLYVFYSIDKSAIYYKVSNLDRIAFPSGIGARLISSTASRDINNPTTTKQTVTPATGFVVLASDNQDYFHAVR